MRIKDFEDYEIFEDGTIYSYKTNKFITGYKSNYCYVDLFKNGKKYKFSRHRLVAEHFINNPNNYTIVGHKDDNPFNNNVDNLYWTTQKENVHKEYINCSPVRNYKECKLFLKNELIKEFKSISECARYAEKELGLSKSSLMKYLKSGDYNIKV